MQLSQYRDELRAITTTVTPSKKYDDFAVELVSHLVERDTTFAAYFDEGVNAPEHDAFAYDVAHLIDDAAAFIAPRYGKGSDEAIGKIINQCLNLAIYIARDEA